MFVNKDLKINVDRANSIRLFLIRSVDENFKKIQKKVFTRDNHTCAYCGFSSHKHMHVVNADGDYYNNNMDNFVTSCPICLLSHFPVGIGRNFSKGTLIFCPEFKQNELNAIIHTLFGAMYNSTDSEKTADALYKALKSRADQVESKLGKGLSNPTMMTQMLIDTPLNDSQRVCDVILKDLRIVPDYVDFKSMLGDWASEAITELS